MASCSKDHNVAVAKAPTFLQEDALTALLNVRHVNRALNCLIMNDVSRFDPTIGDASCEQRVGFVLDTLAKVQTFLESNEKTELARQLVAQYDKEHENDLADTKVRTVADAVGAEDPDGYNDMITLMRGFLGCETTEYIGLCYTFTVASVLALDEFGSPFSYRSKDIFATSTPEAERTKDSTYLCGNERALRAKLAGFSIPYFEAQIRAVPCADHLTIVRNYPTKRLLVEQQLCEADYFMGSVIQAKGGGAIPLKPMYNQFRAIGLQEFNAGRSIVVSVRRIEIRNLVPEASPGARNPLQCDIVESDDKMSDLRYSLGTARAMLFTANRETGRFEHVADPSSQEMQAPCLFLDAWSAYFKDTTGKGMDAADHGEYFTALSKADLWWLVMQYAATHPAYTGHARDKTPGYGPVYDAVCHPQPLDFNYEREYCEGFDLNMHIFGQKRPSLSNEWKMATLMGAARGLTNCQEVRMGSVGGCYLRVERCVDFQIDHVRTLSLRQAEADCKKLVALHQEAKNVTIGSYVVRIGGRGVSCTDKHSANVVMRTKNEKVKKNSYLQKYPENGVLIANRS